MREKKTTHESSSLKRMKHLKYTLICGFAAITFLSILIVSTLAINKTDTIMKDKVATMTSSLNVQMKLNISEYMARMETIGTLAFASQDAFTYDATDEKNDEYEALVTEKNISDQLYSLCIMENFVDYGIVYSNNHFIGKISNGTVSLFGDKLFPDLHAMINRQRTLDGWSAGYGGDFKRIYYVKEIHENAILVISFYATELENVFDNPQTMSDMTIRLTSADYDTIYSSDENEKSGEKIPDYISSRIKGQNAATVLDNEYLITVSSCGDSWYVICSIPTKIILKEKNEMSLYINITAVIAAFLAAILGMVLSIKLTDVITNLVQNLDSKAHTDLLTGVLNKRSFEEAAENRLAQASDEDYHALVLLDVDNFKGVNDTLGHAYGDKVLARIGHTLTSVFSHVDYIGRIGGDEFCVFMNIRPNSGKEYADLIREKCEMLRSDFSDFYTGDNGDYKISCSMGIALFPEHGKSFKDLYAAADKALYNSKHEGKDMFTFFSELNDGKENAE